MASSSASPDRTFPIALDLPEGRIEAEIPLPHGPMRMAELAFNMLGLSSAVSQMGERHVEKLGKKVSCRKGCAACCRQMIPLSPIEAAMVAEMVGSLPQDERQQVERRFRRIEGRLRVAGLWDKLWRLDDPDLSDHDHRVIARQYFELEMPCPFLDESEACSIYEVRPTACREYMVISPAENCSDPFGKEILKVPLSVRLSEAFSRLYAELMNEPPKLIPLTLSLAWTRENEKALRLAAQPKKLLAALIPHVSRMIAEVLRANAGGPKATLANPFSLLRG